MSFENRLLVLVTHGLADWYVPLSLVSNFMKERHIHDVEVLVDSVYFAWPNYQSACKDTGIKLLETVTKNWQPVGSQFFGSDNWYGIPDRRVGPQYKDIKHDFVFYRKACLKLYMQRKLLEKQQESRVTFLCGCGVWSYEWNGSENVPLDFSLRAKLVFNAPSVDEKALMDKVISERPVLIHARKKGWTVNDAYFQAIIDYCNSIGRKTVLIGLKDECRLTNATYDFREVASVEAVMYLVEHNEYMVTSGSMYTFHRFFSGKPTIIGLGESNVDRWHCFHKEDVENPLNIIYDADKEHLGSLLKDIERWK